MKKYLFMGLSLVLCVAMAITGTLAYLQDSDSDVNVMTLGEVDIEQIEQEWNADQTKLVDFTQSKPLYPYVGELGWENRTDDGGAYRRFTMENVVDKYVSVKNTGKTDAYVRTIIALEMGDYTYDEFNVVGISNNKNNGAEFKFDGAWEWTDDFAAKIDGKNYNIMVAVHEDPVKPGETTIPSLLQVYLSKNATNEVVEKLDGNKNGTYDILVVSQAVQTAGFTSAKKALDTAFGAVSEENAVKLFEAANAVDGANANIEFTEAPASAISVEGTDKAAVLDAINNAQPGDTIKLTENTTIAGYDSSKKLIIDKAITLDLNGKTLTTESGWGGIDLKGGASIVNGTINHTGNTAAIKAFQVGKIENVVINVTETAGKVKGGIVVQEGAGCYVGSIKNVVINGATNGIETYRCGDRTDYAIGSMENVTINAIDTGISLSAPVGTVTNCTIKGAKLGINAYLYGSYSVAMELNNCVVEGANADIYAHDEVGKTNPGTMNLTYDGAMALDLNVVCEFESEVSKNVIVAVK